MCAGIITFCTAFGIFISNMGERGKIMMDFFTCLNEIIMKLVALVMWYVIASYVTLTRSGVRCDSYQRFYNYVSNPLVRFTQMNFIWI